MNFIKKTPFFDIYIEPSRSTIVVRSKWKYEWYISESVPMSNYWTYIEKKNWHQKADSVIWNQWGGKYTFWALVADVKNNTNAHLHKKEFNVEFDIQWVTQNQHWLVTVFKTNGIEKFPTHVNVTDRTIYLRKIDVKRRKVGEINQNTVKHEFGHTIGADDEYSAFYGNENPSVYVNDTKALMNIGNELRKRYIDGVAKEVNTMISGVRFVSFLDKI